MSPFLIFTMVTNLFTVSQSYLYNDNYIRCLVNSDFNFNVCKQYDNLNYNRLLQEYSEETEEIEYSEQEESEYTEYNEYIEDIESEEIEEIENEEYEVTEWEIYEQSYQNNNILTIEIEPELINLNMINTDYVSSSDILESFTISDNNIILSDDYNLDEYIIQGAEFKVYVDLESDDTDDNYIYFEKKKNILVVILSTSMIFSVLALISLYIIVKRRSNRIYSLATINEIQNNSEEDNEISNMI